MQRQQQHTQVSLSTNESFETSPCILVRHLEQLEFVVAFRGFLWFWYSLSSSSLALKTQSHVNSDLLKEAYWVKVVQYDRSQQLLLKQVDRLIFLPLVYFYLFMLFARHGFFVLPYHYCVIRMVVRPALASSAFVGQQESTQFIFIKMSVLSAL